MRIERTYSVTVVRTTTHTVTQTLSVSGEDEADCRDQAERAALNFAKGALSESDAFIPLSESFNVAAVLNDNGTLIKG